MATFKVVLAIFLSAVFFGQETSAIGGCPGIWQPLGDSCVWLSPLEQPYVDAVADCQSMGAVLHYPRDELDNNYVIETMWRVHAKLWIGCDDIENEGTFTCQGTGMTFDDWDCRSGEPDNGENTLHKRVQNCAVMMFPEKWADGNCDNSHFYLCRKPK